MTLTEQQKQQILSKYGNNQSSVSDTQATDAIIESTFNSIKNQTNTEQPSFLSRVGTDLKKRASDIVTSFKKEINPQATPLGGARLGLRTAGAIAGSITDIGGEAIKSIADTTGISQAIKPVGLAILDTPLGKAGLEAVKGGVDSYNAFKQANPDTANALEDIINIASILPIGEGAKIVGQTGSDLLKGTSNVLQDASKFVIPKAGQVVDQAPAKIMQRVARISKGKQANFEKMAGESVGTYLTKRNIFGNVDEISQKLFNRFEQSKSEADNALAKLTGTFEPTPVKTALEELLAREKRISSVGAESPNLARTQELLNKIDTQGLTMKEINEAKRLYERNVKLDFVKLTNPEGVARANNLDNAIRSWQIKQAETLGLKNLPAINKETRLAKQLLDDLGKEYSGSAGNNAMTLTDWIMLSGGNPTAVSGFLVKKTFSSKKVQSALAKYLNKGKPVMGNVKADIGTSQVKQLPAGKTGLPIKQINVPIKMTGKSTTEAPAKQIGTFKSNSQAGFISTGKSNPLIEEAKKYKSAEEFVKKQPNIAEYTPLTEQQTNRNIKLLNESGIPVKSGEDILTLYHGTNEKGVKGITESGTLNPFSYLATDKNASKGFVFGKGGDVLEIKVPVKDAGFVQTSMAGAKGATIQNPVRLVKGKDGIWRAEQWKTKAELENTWYKANPQKIQSKIDDIEYEINNIKESVDNDITDESYGESKIEKLKEKQSQLTDIWKQANSKSNSEAGKLLKSPLMVGAGATAIGAVGYNKLMKSKRK